MKRITFAPKDVTLRIQCGVCNNEMLFSKGNHRVILSPDCPLCGERWGKQPDELRPVAELMRALKDMHDYNGPPTVTMEIVDP